MSNTHALQRQIAQLPALDHIALVEAILQGLDATDRSMDALWAGEAESRLAVYKTGQVKAIPVVHTFVFPAIHTFRCTYNAESVNPVHLKSTSQTGLKRLLHMRRQLWILKHPAKV